MIDTVKLAVPYHERPTWFNTVRKDLKRANSGVFIAKIHPIYSAQTYKRDGIYLPKLQYVERPATKSSDKTHELNIELSLTKLYFGNNFCELRDDLFSVVLNVLSKELKAIFGIDVLPLQIEQALVGRIDYSKNIIFTDRTPVSTIIDTIGTADISKTYDVQKTDFKNGGQILHIHTNRSDIVMYDKVADLRQSKVSEKRTHEQDNYTQLNLIGEFDKHPNVTIPRWEIRLNTRRRIRQELEILGIDVDLRFSHLFSTDIARRVLLLHWQKILNSLPATKTTADTAKQILLAHKQTNPNIKFSRASALTLMQLLRNEVGEERKVRNLIEGLFGTVQYYRLKKISHKPPKQTELKDLQHITDTLTAMTPVSITDFLDKL
jgi:hypothetical protein